MSPADLPQLKQLVRGVAPVPYLVGYIYKMFLFAPSTASMMRLCIEIGSKITKHLMDCSEVHLSLESQFTTQIVPFVVNACILKRWATAMLLVYN